MKSKTWLCAVATAALVLGAGSVRAQGNGHGHGHGHGDDDDQSWHGDHGKHGNHGRHGDRDWGRDDDRGQYYRGDDEGAIRNWYRDHYSNLPPGLAKRDELPPGLERQLIVRGTLPPGLRRRIEPCPPELVQELPPPPPHCEHVFIGGHLVLLNRANFQIVDVFHFEL
ncbi:MAG: hypothetical protein KGL02_06050 [Acidobacteriota bacterium]|nr:hypothetical protein [Acidobacteriota bacterium]MDE3168748.1 hypothetical protein [Acidobacteriota bacterium]